MFEQILNTVITIVLAVVAIVGGVFGILAYKKQGKQADTQENALKFQFEQQEELRKKEHLAQEERQKLRTTEQFDKLKNELAEQKASADKNNSNINLRLDTIEKKVDKFEDIHTQVEVIKTNSNHVLEMVREIKEQLREQPTFRVSGIDEPGRQISKPSTKKRSIT